MKTKPFVSLKKFLQLLDRQMFLYSGVNIPETTSDKKFLSIAQAGLILKELLNGKGDNVVDSTTDNAAPLRLDQAVNLLKNLKPWVDTRYATKFTATTTGDAFLTISADAVADFSKVLISVNDSEFRTPIDGDTSSTNTLKFSLTAGDTVRIAGPMPTIMPINLTLDGILGKHNLATISGLALAMPNGVIPEGLFKNNPNIETMFRAFSAMSQETAQIKSIPKDLFDYTPKVTFLDGCFQNQKITEIPKELFHKLPELLSINYMFSLCTLKEIPEDLLKYNSKLVVADEAFAGVYYDPYDTVPDVNTLTSIPADIFRNKPALTSVKGSFKDQTKLAAIPVDMFVGSPEITDISQMFSATSVGAIPDKLLHPLVKLTHAAGFVSNTNLTSIPEDLFANNPDLYDISDAFGTTKITDIPSQLLENNTKLERCGQLFNNVHTITTVPEGLFVNNTLLTRATRCFSYCENLTTVPTNLWDTNTSLQRVDQMFAYCPNITSTVPELWDKARWPNISRFSQCYYGVTKASNVASIPADWK